MSAEILREAAALMRERAESVPAGPWVMYDGWGPTSDGLMAATCIASRPSGERVLQPAEGRDIYGTRAAFEHIATFANPAVALAVADWLDSTANAAGHTPNALAVARAYLGSDA